VIGNINDLGDVKLWDGKMEEAVFFGQKEHVAFFSGE
jgi:hypothetical protein